MLARWRRVVAYTGRLTCHVGRRPLIWLGVHEWSLPAEGLIVSQMVRSEDQRDLPSGSPAGNARARLSRSARRIAVDPDLQPPAGRVVRSVVACSAPSSCTTLICACLDTSASTCAPRAPASCTASPPTAPAAPATSSRSPCPTCSQSRVCNAVSPGRGRAAASTSAEGERRAGRRGSASRAPGPAGVAQGRGGVVGQFR